jgi:hypothetical protein
MSRHSDLQIAEILADLFELNLAVSRRRRAAPLTLQDPDAAHALVSAHRTLTPNFARRRSRVGLSFSPPHPSTPPSLSRMTSGVSSASVETVEEAVAPPDPDLQRAAQLMELHQIKTRIAPGGVDWQQLQRLRADVAEAAARIDAWRLEEEQSPLGTDAQDMERMQVAAARRQRERLALEREEAGRRERLMEGEEEDDEWVQFVTRSQTS